ncbi:isochorismatase family protein [Paenibacillus sp. CGMCC 1.16610]|uniref:Isochorismatase family protein n=1 Tax=Paenibacillus anseongense TaxID=2682845 RepID=A0ABW9UKA2_9BACL|nr:MULTISPECIES: isochorismatase family protein [Paenibacillus]MBA2939766.1 isochorismatase family protein [Paenibacillus sp. CGMCC 1.16610]MVQ39426.1 isochorismatase family protein [Paenibacillus anseongense]
MNIDYKTTAVVVTDPQNAFLSPTGSGYELTKDVLNEVNTIKNLDLVFKTAKEQNYQVFISPHYYYPHDHKWEILSAGEKMMHDLMMFNVDGPQTAVPKSSQADFYDLYKPYIEDGKTIITSPHKIFGPETNDLVLQLRKRGMSKVLLAGMNSNICVDSHMRELVEQGFEVAVIFDATGAPGFDAYNAGKVNFGILSSGSWTTEEAIGKMKGH